MKWLFCRAQCNEGCAVGASAKSLQTRTSSSNLVCGWLVLTRSCFPPSCHPTPHQSSPSRSTVCMAAVFVAPKSRMFPALKVVVMRCSGNLRRLLSCTDSCQSCAVADVQSQGRCFFLFCVCAIPLQLFWKCKLRHNNIHLGAKHTRWGLGESVGRNRWGVEQLKIDLITHLFEKITRKMKPIKILFRNQDKKMWIFSVNFTNIFFFIRCCQLTFNQVNFQCGVTDLTDLKELLKSSSRNNETPPRNLQEVQTNESEPRIVHILQCASLSGWSLESDFLLDDLNEQCEDQTKKCLLLF